MYSCHPFRNAEGTQLAVASFKGRRSQPALGDVTVISFNFCLPFHSDPREQPQGLSVTEKRGSLHLPLLGSAVKSPQLSNTHLVEKPSKPQDHQPIQTYKVLYWLPH